MALEHDAVREKLITATLALMDQSGLEAVKARSLAQDVGVSVGTIYNLFGSVDGLIAVANQRIYAQLDALGQGSVAGIEADIEARIAKGEIGGSARERTRERLLGLASVYIDFVEANARRWNAVLAFNRSHGAEETPEGYFAQLDALIDIIGGVLQAAPRFTEVEARRKAGRAMWSAVHGIVTSNYLGAEDAAARARTWELVVILVAAFTDGIFSDV